MKYRVFRKCLAKQCKVFWQSWRLQCAKLVVTVCKGEGGTHGGTGTAQKGTALQCSALRCAGVLASCRCWCQQRPCIEACRHRHSTSEVQHKAARHCRCASTLLPCCWTEQRHEVQPRALTCTHHHRRRLQPTTIRGKLAASPTTGNPVCRDDRARPQGLPWRYTFRRRHVSSSSSSSSS